MPGRTEQLAQCLHHSTNPDVTPTLHQQTFITNWPVCCPLSLRSITVQLAHILHSVSHWPVLVYYLLVETSSSKSSSRQVLHNVFFG
jgi:hypothetical protein